MNGKLVFGAVCIEWDPLFEFPIALDHEHPGMFVTQCWIVYRYGRGDYQLAIRIGYRFDGASIPRLLRWLFPKLDWHLLGTLPHDWVCDHPELLPRPVGDGIFISVLLAIAETKQRRVQAWLMYLAVSAWTIREAVRGTAMNTAAVPPTDTTGVLTYAAFECRQRPNAPVEGSGRAAGGDRAIV